MIFRTLSLFVLACASSLTLADQVITNKSPLQHKQTIKNANNPHFEIANPRYVFNTAAQVLLVVSGDSNALSIFKQNEQQKFQYSQSFSKQHNHQLALEGASDISYVIDSDIAIVSSFYSGSLSTFKRSDNGQFKHVETLTDHIDMKQAFRDYKKVRDKDTFKLIGAWDTLISQDNKTLYVASYQSNAVSTFEVNSSGKLNFLGQLLPNHNWGKPTSIAQSKDANWLYISGFEQSKISILHREKSAKYRLSQSIAHREKQIQTMQNPQQIVITPDNQFLFVAASKSNSLNVFKRNASEYFELIQVIDHKQTDGLSGACCIAYADKHNLVFAAGEADKGFLVFRQSPSSGELTLIEHIKHSGLSNINGVSSISLSQDGQRVFVTTGKNNEIFIFEII
ncbi:hypothetical protein N473_21520 [Pseudoalteromonas luteoviolacea CPMOR-1]|uniref:6-phosphogluconolactonase n=1 Tax=Pseudoalteromonas luteoviolacea CPMOR-1 TaxID=1365248 RepID=A0A167K4M0_9GAMM|nr:beta-propeller fold lactonase family protein [Pseudoalteromonas luteoviolacea]KZN62128.1 hypothetical protein N473_21520 [Pseudoalteromonas luteoviolacea CPMOR-1]